MLIFNSLKIQIYFVILCSNVGSVTCKTKISYTLRNPWILQTNANVSRKASAIIYQSTRRRIPEAKDLH